MDLYKHITWNSKHFYGSVEKLKRCFLFFCHGDYAKLSDRYFAVRFKPKGKMLYQTDIKMGKWNFDMVFFLL